MRASARALPVSVCVLPPSPKHTPRTVTYPHCLLQEMKSLGLCCGEVPLEEVEQALPGLRVLVTIGECALPEGLLAQLRTWVRGGGAWLSIGGVCGAPDLFGVEPQPPAHSSWGGGVSSLGEGYLEPHDRLHPVMSAVTSHPHFFGGLPVLPAGCRPLAFALDAHQNLAAREEAETRVALAENRVGAGLALLLAPDLTGTLARIRQGVAVTRDGVPADDGSGPVNEQVLKSDDGAVLDWIFDRQPVPGAPGLRAFLEPMADVWVDILARCVCYACAFVEYPLPVLDRWPRGLPAVGHLSLDTDLNEVDRCERMLGVLEEIGVRATWCVILPGYPRHRLRAIRAAGHELAMHFDALSEPAIFSREAFATQHEALTDLFEGDAPVTNKNHYLRWEGDTEFFAWCVERSILLDQSKGPSKTGEAGFLFGTCHPYQPVSPEGLLLDVLELPTLTQDLEVFAPRALLQPLAHAALKYGGVLHLLFHPTHLANPAVEAALREAVALGTSLGMEWWTAEQIARWSRARLAARWTLEEEGERLQAPKALEGATVLRMDLANARGGVERWGFRFATLEGEM